VAWTIDYDRNVRKAIEKLDHVIRKRIRTFLHERVALLDDPRTLGRALEGQQFNRFWRYRVGDYRIICDIQDNRLIVLVIEVGHRREVYRRR
jgi:addiction module toxin, RelE/StbE family